MKILLAALAVFAMALSGLAWGGSSTPVAEAAPVTINVMAVGANENPAVSGPGAANGRFTFDKATKQLTYVVRVTGLSSNLVTAAHIHRGAAGVNGPIVYPLSTVAFELVTGSITLTDADIADLEAGRLYFNVHSIENPGGFARGQMILPGSASAGTPAAVSPPNTGDAGLVDASSSSLPAIAGLVLAVSAGTLALARRRA